MKIIKQSATLEFVTPNALELIEQAGRTCYKSEDKITSDSNIKFIQMLLDPMRRHESVIEHASATMRFITDRGVTHEMVRHRLASYSQESTRYCNYSKDKHGNELTFILPVWFYDLYEDMDLVQESIQHAIWFRGCQDSELYYLNLLDAGQSPQQARTVLNNSLKTEIVMTANLREWRWFFEKRCNRAAHPQMKELAFQACKLLQVEVPILFDEYTE